MSDAAPKKARTQVEVMAEMIGGQAATIARLTAIIESTVPALRAELDAALAELATLKPPAPETKE